MKRQASGPAGAGADSDTPDPGSDESMDTGVDSGSKGLVHKIFDVERGDLMALAAGHGKSYDYRGVLEPTAAKAQCDKVIGKFEADTPCYLCGLEIPTTEGKTSSHELYPECEHILPVTEARWYLDLYMSRPETELGDWASERLRLEYAYAHRVCNQAKSNISFVKPFGINLQTSDKGFLRILTNIRNRAAKSIASGEYVGDGDDVLLKIRDTILKRGPTIREEKIIPILTHTARKQDEASLITLSRVAKLIDVRTAKKEVQRAFDQYSGPTKEEKDQQQSELIAQMYDANPLLEENRLRASLKARFPELSTLIDSVVTRILVDTILSTYLTVVAGRKSRAADSSGAETEREPLGVHLTQIVPYGAYLAVFNEFRERIEAKTIPLNDAAATTLCALYNTLRVFFEIEELKTALPVIVGPLPPENLVKLACDKVGRAERAATRLAIKDLREEEEEVDIGEEPLTKEEAIVYYFNDLPNKMTAAGLSVDDANSLTAFVVDQYREQPFEATNPLAALQDIPLTVSTTITLMNQYPPSVADTAKVVLETLGNEGYLGRDEEPAVYDAADTVDGDGDAPMSNAGAGPAGLPGGKRKAIRRPLYG